MLFKDLKIEEQQILYGQKVRRIKPTNTGGCYFEVVSEPFGNCQMCSVAWMDYFLIGSENVSDFIENLKYIFTLSSKKLVLVDLTKGTLNRLIKFITESNGILDDLIVFRREYESTNGSEMTIVQLNLTKILQ